MAVGLQIGTQPPVGAVRAYVAAARAMRLDSMMTIDHFANVFPTVLWDTEFSWLAARRPTPHELFDYQTLLGFLASRAGRMRLGVGVTEPVRRHPVLIAQAMMTLAHLTRRAPILGIGAGERLNIDPYGLDFSRPVTRLEEALQIITTCFTSRGPITFSGEHYVLDGAVMDLEPPTGKTPEIWVAGHGPRMLSLTGRYGDGWYPTMVTTPEEYATKLDVIRTAALQAGREPGSITPALHRFAVIGQDDAEVRTILGTKSIRALGLALPAEQWRKAGADHPLGEHFDGVLDLVPERYDRATLEAAIASVPPALIEQGPLLWGTPDQVVARLREFGEAGVRHVVLAPLSGLVSPRSARYDLWAVGRIAHALRS